MGNTFDLNYATSIDLLGLLSDHDYTFEVIAKIDDGAGGFTTETVFSSVISTTPKLLEAISISDLSTAASQITVSITSVLPDDAVIDKNNINVILYELDGNGDYVQIGIIAVTSGQTTYVFSSGIDTALDTYLITIEATVDFNDGEGAIADYIIDSKTFIISD